MNRSARVDNPFDHSHWVQAVARACDLLSSFGPADQVMSLHDLAAHCSLSKATASRLLCTLEVKGFVERVGRGGYRSKVRKTVGARCRMGLNVYHDNDAFLRAITESITEAASGASVDLVARNSRGNRRASLAHAGQLIAEGVSVAMEVQPLAEVGARCAELYAEAGVAVIAVGFPQHGAYYFGPDRYRAGRLAGSHLARWADRSWSGQVDELLLLTAEVYGPAVQAWTTGLEDELAGGIPDARGVTLTRLDTRGTFDHSLDLVRRRYRRRSGGKTLVAAVNDGAGLGALEAVRELGLETSYAIVGQGGSAEARRELRRGGSRFIGTVAQFPESYGERVLRMALDCVNHKAVPRVAFGRQMLLTATNVDQVYAADRYGRLLVGGQVIAEG
jgi:ribose transport system substrate-binding protein